MSIKHNGLDYAKALSTAGPATVHVVVVRDGAITQRLCATQRTLRLVGDLSSVTCKTCRAAAKDMGWSRY